MSEMRRRAAEGLRVGDTFTVTRTFSLEDVIRFGDISRDYNPVHYEPRFAEVKGLPGRICHGLLVASMVTEIGGQLAWLASGMDFRFRKAVLIGETVTCRFTITSIDEQGRAEGKALFENQHGEVVLEATLAGRVPGPRDRRILSTMLAEGDPTNPLSEEVPDPEACPSRPGKSCRLIPIPRRFILCRLSEEEAPTWVLSSSFLFLTRTAKDLSALLPEDRVPERKGPRWRGWEVEGPLDPLSTGVLASLCGPLASAEIPVFAFSGARTDYLFVPEDQWDKAVRTLTEAGHKVG